MVCAPHNYCCLLQEYPGLRGTPLAMLAAQCNKLSSMSPPPLADAAVGKGFHPWKKSDSDNSSTESQSVTPGPRSSSSQHSTASSPTTTFSNSGGGGNNSNNNNNTNSGASQQQSTSSSPNYSK